MTPEEGAAVARVRSTVDAHVGVVLPGVLAEVYEDLRLVVRAIDRLELELVAERLANRVLVELHGKDAVPVDDAVDAVMGAVYAPRPDWSRLQATTRDVAATIGDDVSLTAKIDGNGAWFRDLFDALGLSIRHEETLYTAICAMTVLVEMSGNMAAKGVPVAEALSPHVAMLTRTFIASIFDYLPAEAKG